MILKLGKTLAFNSLVIVTVACSDPSVDVSKTAKDTTTNQELNVTQTEPLKSATNLFSIVDEQHKQTLYLDEEVDPLIEWAAKELVSDIFKLTGQQLALVKTDQVIDAGIYIGQVSDPLINQTILLTANTRDQLVGQWESFTLSASEQQLAVVGSDVRGTVYAIFDIAERLGVSPWQWWADVTVLPQTELALRLTAAEQNAEQNIVQSPSVQYRGIFLNDEDWGLQPWAAKTFEPDVNDIGPKTYEKIFQLLLRLKANTLWPAMHPSTKAFYQVAGNQDMAKQYHIVVGTSHAEPMLRNNVDEWDKEKFGQYNYVNNSEIINQYWQQRVEQVKAPTNQNMFTIGMRGVHDSHMEGVKSTEQAIDLLTNIMTTQRKMLTDTLAKPINEIPQVFIPYKEVLNLYNNGLTVPDDVTLMWTDDNYGYIRRLSSEQEQQRIGGSGIYYHLSYWGRPHDYLWLSSTQPALIWYEMSKAYANGAKKIWIANVGDIKPSEYSMELFLDLAWNVKSISANSIHTHLRDWAEREFGREIANEVAEVMNEYYRLAFIRKPEFMGWSQTEPTTQTYLTEFNQQEAYGRIKQYDALTKKVDLLTAKVASARLSAWFQLVEYPVKGAANMNDKFLYRQLASQCIETGCQQKYQQLSTKAYQNIKQLTEHYNTQISQGKWQHMMSMSPRNLPVYQAPTFDVAKNEALNVTISSEQLAPQKSAVKKSNDAIYLQAHQFSASSQANEYHWQTIDGLGYSNKAVTLIPFKSKTFSVNQPWLEYDIDIKNTGNFVVEIRVLPTHANQFDDEISVQLNGQAIGKALLNTQGRSQAWKTNVLRNSQIKTFPVTITKTGKHKLKIAVNQTGIVLDQLAIYPENIGTFYEIPYQMLSQ